MDLSSQRFSIIYSYAVYRWAHTQLCSIKALKEPEIIEVQGISRNLFNPSW
jgi:hypothetical protein